MSCASRSSKLDLSAGKSAVCREDNIASCAPEIRVKELKKTGVPTQSALHRHGHEADHCGPFVGFLNSVRDAQADRTKATADRMGPARQLDRLFRNRQQIDANHRR